MMGCSRRWWGWTWRTVLRFVDERPYMADHCFASPYLWTNPCGQRSASGTTKRVDAEIGLDATINHRSRARSGLLLNSFELEPWLVHGCRRRAQQLCC
ncbi:hypothetical protein NL676_029108 [Syzygium grande]|nr:hypothetical protein NL676_029108 [Syzygium grande]